MKKILFFSILIISSLSRADIAMDTVVLRSMDKITGRVQKLNVKVNEKTKIGTLSIIVQKCLKKPPEETPEDSAFLTIIDEDIPDKPVFNGWMFSSNPALSAMEHPVYDIWVVECGKISEKQSVISETSDVLPDDTEEPIED